MKKIPNSKECQEAITSNQYVDIVIETNFENIEEEVLRFKAICYQRLTDTIAVLHVKLDHAITCEDYYKKMPANFFPNLYGIQGERSLESTGIQQILESPTLDITGRGVIVGIIDTGIDYTHEAFIYEDYTSKILSIWDQTGKENPPEGFLYGSEYTNDQINEAIHSKNPSSIVPEEDEDGHRTFVAGIAAGGPNEDNNFIGAAPEAEIVVVKLKEAKECLKEISYIKDDAKAYQINDILLAVNYVLQKVKTYNKPVVILLTVGTNFGPHNGNGLLGMTCAKYGRQDGVVFVLAAGNEGIAGHHYKGVFNKEEKKEVLFNVDERQKGLALTLWYSVPDKYTIELISPAGTSTGILPILTEKKQEVSLLLEGTDILVEYILVEERTGDQLISIILKKPSPGVWTLVVYGDILINRIFNIWMPIKEFVYDQTIFIEDDPYITIVEPGNNYETITIGAYNDRINSIYLPSSNGFNTINQVKPDLVAPGVNIIGPYLNNSYGTMSGSNIAAAITAGACALLLEWGIVKRNDTSLDTIRAKTYLIRGARRRDTLKYPNREWGFGELDIMSTLILR